MIARMYTSRFEDIPSIGPSSPRCPCLITLVRKGVGGGGRFLAGHVYVGTLRHQIDVDYEESAAVLSASRFSHARVIRLMRFPNWY